MCTESELIHTLVTTIFSTHVSVMGGCASNLDSRRSKVWHAKCECGPGVELVMGILFVAPSLSGL